MSGAAAARVGRKEGRAEAREPGLSQEEADAMRETLRDCAPRFDEVLAPRTRVFHLSAQLPTINIIYGQRDRLPDPKPRLVGGKLALAAKLLGLIVLIVGYYYGPSYLTCRRMQERGMFYYGTTMSTCMRERMAERVDPFEIVLRKLVPVL